MPTSSRPIILLAVVAAIVLPVVLGSDTPGTRRVGLTGTAPAGLPAALTAQAAATGSRVELHTYPSQQLAELLTPARLDERILARGNPGRATTEAAAFAMLVVLFTAITVYGGQVLTGVVEEKSTRVVAAAGYTTTRGGAGVEASAMAGADRRATSSAPSLGGCGPLTRACASTRPRR